MQHSGADRVTIHLEQSEPLFTLEISDNGCGFDLHQAQNGGMGLPNMRERARQIGATLSIESVPKQGTRLCLSLPGSGL